MDFRCIRYIAVMSPEKYGFNGSTDYSSEMFHKAMENESYSICLDKDRRLPFCYIDDIVEGTV